MSDGYGLVMSPQAFSILVSFAFIGLMVATHTGTKSLDRRLILHAVWW